MTAALYDAATSWTTPPAKGFAPNTYSTWILPVVSAIGTPDGNV